MAAVAPPNLPTDRTNGTVTFNDHALNHNAANTAVNALVANFNDHLIAGNPHDQYLTEGKGDGRYLQLTGGTVTGILSARDLRSGPNIYPVWQSADEGNVLEWRDNGFFVPTVAGEPGAAGPRGSLWYSASGEPTSILVGAIDKDHYLDTVTGDVWIYEDLAGSPYGEGPYGEGSYGGVG